MNGFCSSNSFWRLLLIVALVEALAACISLPKDLEGRVAEAYATDGARFGPLQTMVVASYLSGTGTNDRAVGDCAVAGTARVRVLGVACRPEDAALAATLSRVPDAIGELLGVGVPSRGIEVVRTSAAVGVHAQQRAVSWGAIPRMRFHIRDQSSSELTSAVAVEVAAHELVHALHVREGSQVPADDEELSAAWTGSCVALALTGRWVPRDSSAAHLRSSNAAADSSLQQSARVQSELEDVPSLVVCGDRARSASRHLHQTTLPP